MKKISIVIPCYNDPVYIREAVKSAIAQTYQNKEIIIVDDGSNHGTKSVLAELSTGVTKIISQSNQGLSAARNAGIAFANGEYILVLDSDDFFEPTFCEKAVSLKEANASNYKIITCYAKRFDDRGFIDIFKPQGGTIKNFLFSNSAIGNSLFAKADWIDIEGYDEKMTSGYEDWEFYIRLLKLSGEAVVIEEPLFNYRQKNQSMRISANRIKYELWRYIFNKHISLYKQHYEEFIDYFLQKLEQEEVEKIKNTTRLEFKIGEMILAPFRFLKKIFK
ncbi:glycosyltransferase family 2 protein [Psychroflexus sp. CAK1W]|uniref:glycosyltransferase family 2 protein n=1 Tax=Psychroflexus curvus TaxID=2873595 RepID=UPI001CCA8CB5|nr:glycosyltransferase family A protein [Psychroflexus curvus]MBZ9628905.1 glycosyltransferase family 2 protein [Psychroflexus curvus]